MPEKLALEIEASRREIEKLQDRVRQLVSGRDKRAELAKVGVMQKAGIGPESPSISGSPVTSARSGGSARFGVGEFVAEKEMSFEEGLAALRETKMSAVRLIAFHRGNVVFLLSDDHTVTVKLDARGPKPLFDLLSANDAQGTSTTLVPAPAQARLS